MQENTGAAKHCRSLVVIICAWIITTLSVAACMVLWREYRPLCARAWVLRDIPFWASWVREADSRLAWFELDHCERSANRWN